MLYLQGKCSNDTNLKHNGQFFILNDFCRVPASGMFISSFLKKDKGTMNAFTEAESGQENIQLPELQLSSAPISLSTLAMGTQDIYTSTTCVTHSHSNMGEHITLTQTKHFQFLVVEHGLKTSQDSSH